jgi:hypothetical protein
MIDRLAFIKKLSQRYKVAALTTDQKISSMTPFNDENPNAGTYLSPL